MFPPNWVSPGSTNGGPCDAQHKVNCPFPMIHGSFGVIKTTQSHTPWHPLPNIMKGAVNDNSLHWCRASPFPNLHISLGFYDYYSHSSECQCVAQATPPELRRLQLIPPSYKPGFGKSREWGRGRELWRLIASKSNSLNVSRVCLKDICLLNKTNHRSEEWVAHGEHISGETVIFWQTNTASWQKAVFPFTAQN